MATGKWWRFSLRDRAFFYVWVNTAARSKDVRELRVTEIEARISGLLDKIVKVTSDAVLVRFEDQIATLEREKLGIAEKLSQDGRNHKPFDEMFELAMRFFSSLSIGIECCPPIGVQS